MEDAQPRNLAEYRKWLERNHNLNLTKQYETYYVSVSSRMKDQILESDLWDDLRRILREAHEAYSIQNGYPLLRSYELDLEIKPYESFLRKSLRKNVVRNSNWPNPPNGGWILHSNWFSKIRDITRCLVEVKYLDGVSFVMERILSFCSERNLSCETTLEARKEGYYAGHVLVETQFDIPRRTWDTKRISGFIEIQITTQLQEVIRKLLHEYYEKRRIKIDVDDEIDWRWDFQSDEFAAGYLGHILHYVEGMIMDIREKQKASERLP